MQKNVANFLNLLIELGLISAEIKNDQRAMFAFEVGVTFPFGEEVEEEHKGDALSVYRSLFDIYNRLGEGAVRFVTALSLAQAQAND